MSINKNLGGLDALRGVLSIVVCVAHTWHTFVAPFFPENQQQTALVLGIIARLAVISFFCLSGYVIAMSIAKNVERHGAFNVSDYALARCFRILPPLLVVIGLVFLGAVVAKYFGFNTLPDGVTTVRDVLQVNAKGQILAILTLGLRGDLTGYLNGPLWTLGFEIQLYVIAGLVAFGLFSRRHRVVFRVVVAAIALVFIRGFLQVSSGAPIFPNAMWLCFFIFGVIAFTFLNTLSRGSLWCIGLIGAANFLGVASQVSLQKYTAGIDTGNIGILSQLAYGVASTAAIISLSRVRVSPLMRSLGDFSYTLYILHFPIVIFSFFIIENSLRIRSSTIALTWAVIVIAISLLASWFLAIWIERPAAQRTFLTKVFNNIVNRQLFRF